MKIVNFLATLLMIVACVVAAITLPMECQLAKFIFAILAVVYWFIAAEKGFELFDKGEYHFFRVEEMECDPETFDEM